MSSNNKKTTGQKKTNLTGIKPANERPTGGLKRDNEGKNERIQIRNGGILEGKDGGGGHKKK